MTIAHWHAQSPKFCYQFYELVHSFPLQLALLHQRSREQATIYHTTQHDITEDCNLLVLCIAGLDYIIKKARKQRRNKFNGLKLQHMLNCNTIKHGVFQGSMFGPLLFHIPVSYTSLTVNSYSKPILFANHSSIIQIFTTSKLHTWCFESLEPVD